MCCIYIRENAAKERSAIDMRPYIYTTPEKVSFLVASSIGGVGWVIDLNDTLDWWITSPWHLEQEEVRFTEPHSMS